VRAYFAGTRSQHRPFADLHAELERPGRDLSEWSRAWLQTSGVHPAHRPHPRTARAQTSAPHRAAVGLYDRALGGWRAPARLDVEVRRACESPSVIDLQARPPHLLLRTTAT
jgi:aminopeptidase N